MFTNYLIIIKTRSFFKNQTEKFSSLLSYRKQPVR